ncbi:xylT [Symbiodinium necroappetens]|uniref:XylT protein n=1 Tax=Symbiodinium necroappetens TaxID=1628268 RepID=A0A812NNT2_9DINO|nr:xylT [Symbiodinium necroappetens]
MAACAEDGIRDPVTVTEALDALVVGSFHAGHLLRMILFWAVLAMTQECTPYLFPGLRKGFEADDESVASFAAAFPLGCVLGSVAATFLLDRLGRRGFVVIASPMAVAVSLASIVAPSFRILLGLRVLQSVVIAISRAALSTWYIEFLSTNYRGTLMAVYSLGWPLGRAAVILTASMAKEDWSLFMSLNALGFTALFIVMHLSEESPRFLVASGRLSEANDVLTRLYASNRQAPWKPCSQLCLDKASADAGPSDDSRTWSRLFGRGSRHLLLFACLLFAVLASTTVLLDTWGPGLYHTLLAPESPQLPTHILMLFNVGDLCGIAVSIMIVDRIGRAGSFVIGFFVQGMLLAIVGILDAREPHQYYFAIVCGTLAATCRCFAWESAQMWTLEAFPTDLRAKAFSTAAAVMHSVSILSLKVSGHQVHRLTAASCLLFLAAMKIAGGFLSTGLMPKETAREPMTERLGSGTRVVKCS